MSELGKKVAKAIERYKMFEPEEGYYLAFSGGKDSVVIKVLAEMAGVKYDAHYNLTSVDPPELVRFIREKHADVAIDVPRYKDGRQIMMWNLIPKKLMPPTRVNRYCCEVFKERCGKDRLTVTGVRWAESSRRKSIADAVVIHSTARQSARYQEQAGGEINKYGGLMLNNDNDVSRKLVESCYKKHTTVLNPIIDWSDKDIWDFIKAEGIPYCSLYDEGMSRLGCIGCPMATTHERERDFLRWPTYKKAYIRAFEKMLNERKAKGKESKWQTGKDVFNWWMEYDILPGQIDLFEED